MLPPASLSGWLDYLEALHPKGQAGIALGLDRVRRVRAALGQAVFCPLIVVGGTNGKGSVCAYLESILHRAGIRTGCYTSPHLLDYNERVRLSSRPADDAVLCAAFARVEAARLRAAVPLTYFEFGTLAAWEVFREAEVEAAILEVGLGGRLDAVNVYDADLAIVTGIALDHTDWLGSDREAIGFEKAGIFRPGRPALCADPDPPRSLLDHAEAIGARLECIGRDFGFVKAAADRRQWRWWRRSGDALVQRSLAYPALRGEVQLANAAVALAALECLSGRLPVSMQAIREGLMMPDLPGRFQVLPGRPSVVLDVGHNPQALRVLADNLDAQGFFEHTCAVVGMLNDKDIAGALAAFRGKISHWHLATLAGPRGTGAAALARIVDEAGLGGEIFRHDSPALAMTAARSAAGDSDRIVVFGSFHTVAGALEALAVRKGPNFPKNRSGQ